jgi:DNA excision repair protein ERCC-2
VVDAKCRERTAPWAGENGMSCTFFDRIEELTGREGGLPLPKGVYTLEELKAHGQRHTLCPYFLARKAVTHANVIIYSYHYLLDPKIAELVSKDLARQSIVVFDEAHNIDNVCTESLSIDLTRPTLDASARSLTALSARIETLKESSSAKLQGEYERLVQGLREANEARANQAILANPVLPQDVLTEAVPGNIRKAEHFVAFLTRFVEYLKTRMRVLHVVAESPASFLHHLKEITYIDKKPLRWVPAPLLFALAGLVRAWLN